jgi:hypothetical protein
VRLTTIAAVLLILAAAAPAFAQTARRAGAPVRGHDRFLRRRGFRRAIRRRQLQRRLLVSRERRNRADYHAVRNKSGPLLGFFFDVRVWKSSSAGISFTGYASESDAHVTERFRIRSSSTVRAR